MTAENQKIVPLPAINADELRERVRAVLDKEGISQNTAAREAGLSSSALSQWLTDQYRGDNVKTAQAVMSWLNARSASDKLHAVMPTAPAWVEAPTARRIFEALSYAQMAGDIAVIYGGAGLSKTTTIRHYASDHPNVWTVTATPATSSVGVFLEEMALTMGLHDFALHPARLHRTICKSMRDTRGLLVIDEAQHLTKQALEAARSIHDATGIGLALAGNASVFNRIYGRGDNGFAQLFSRVGKRVPLVRPLAGDVHAVAAAFGVTGKDQRADLEELGRRPGALRMVVKTLRLASVFAQGKPIEVAHIRAAIDDLQGPAVIAPEEDR